MSENNQENKLRDEILGDAKIKAERLITRARNEAAKIVDAAKRDAAAKKKERMAEVEAEMNSKCRSIAMGVETQLRRHWLAAREEKLEAMLERAVKQAESMTGAEHARSMELLAQEAIVSIGNGHLLAYFPQQDATLVTEQWLNQIAQKANVQDVSFELHPTADAPAGIRFITDDGHKEFDNTYASRLLKMKDSIRILLSDEI